MTDRVTTKQIEQWAMDPYRFYPGLFAFLLRLPAFFVALDRVLEFADGTSTHWDGCEDSHLFCALRKADPRNQGKEDQG